MEPSYYISIPTWKRWLYSLIYMNSFRDERFLKTIVNPPKPGSLTEVMVIIYSIVTSHIGQVVLLLFYSLIGAAIFYAIDLSSWHSNLDHGGEGFLEALYFCFTVYSTIGYGNIYATTTGGRWFTILYAAFGIPLYFVTIVNLGICLRKCLHHVYNQIGRCLCANNSATSDLQADGTPNQDMSIETTQMLTTSGDDKNVPFFIPIIITVLYILFGVLIHLEYEEWNAMETFYFLVSTLSSIGLGDLYATKVPFILFWVYTMFGFILVAMTIDIICTNIKNLERRIYS